ncbi:hypothetical protein BaRGS_00023967 [Batillaria attramentaria]|uniref:Uncharacterized protein n=1 Tax=Batillaria attramentaria TaxID=370345 RepID=A0ABD0KCD4_9CAEN
MLVEKKRNHNQSTCRVLLDNRNNSTVFWKHVRNSARRKREQPRVKIDCDEWETHFRNVLTGHADNRSRVLPRQPYTLKPVQRYLS